MPTNADNNKRIAKNTLLLYFGLIITLLTSLYTSRIVLEALGVENYGIYNVVGGVVAMFGILSSSLSSSIGRFFAFEIGKKNLDKLKRVFATAVTIQALLALLIIIVIEIVGVWFLNNKMNIPDDRMFAANWVLQLSIVTFIINFASIPYHSAIIAHERMAAFAYISLLESAEKLILSYLITISPIDMLIFYAILMCFVAVTIRLAYSYYSKKHFKECIYHFSFEKDLFKQIISFTGWNFIGISTMILRDQGGNILINIFQGPTVNAARAIACQVQYAIQGFANNFMLALNPQITKSYAIKDYHYMSMLIRQGAKFSFYLLLLLSLPVFISTQYILSIWLKIVPGHTVLFIQLILLFTMCESLSQPLKTVLLATGNIKKYQIIIGLVQFLNFPLSLLLLYKGYMPECIFVISIILSFCSLIVHLILCKSIEKSFITIFFKNVILNAIIVSLFSATIPLIIKQYLPESFINFIVLTISSMLCTAISIYYIGCTRKEKAFIKAKTSIAINRISKRIHETINK